MFLQYISIQWALKSLGAIIGGSISLAISINQLELPGVSEPVYVAFIVIHLSAIFIALFFIVHPRDVVRQDGTHIAVFDGNKAAVWPEIKATVAVLLDARYMMLAPAQVVCEMAFGLLSSVNCEFSALPAAFPLALVAGYLVKMMYRAGWHH